MKSPVKDSVSLAVVLPAAAPDSEEMARVGIAVTSSKPDAVTPLANVVSASLTVTVAVLRVLSVGDEGLVDAIDAP